MISAVTAFLAEFAALLLSFGYAGLFAVSFVAAFAIPVPSSTALALSGALAAQGGMNLYAVLAVALAGNVSADLLAFFLARRYGVEVLQRAGLGRVLRSKSFGALEGYLRAHPAPIIYVTRVVTEAGPAVNILAGLSAIRTPVFVFFDLIGELSFVLLFGLSGYFLGDAWQSNTDFLATGVLVLASLGIVGGIAQAIYRYETNRR